MSKNTWKLEVELNELYKTLIQMEILIDHLEFNGESLSNPSTGSVIAHIGDFNKIDGFIKKELHLLDVITDWELA